MKNMYEEDQRAYWLKYIYIYIDINITAGEENRSNKL